MRGPRGLQVFAQLACESRNRERHSSFEALAFHSLLRSIGPVSFDLKSRSYRDINLPPNDRVVINYNTLKGSLKFRIDIYILT